MDAQTEKGLKKRLLELYPNYIYDSIKELKTHSVYSILKIQAKEMNISETALLKKMGFEKLMAYDIKRMKEIIKDYDFIQSDYSGFFGVKRQAISPHMDKTPNRHYFWKPRNLTTKEVNQLINQLIKPKKWHLHDPESGMHYQLLTNFNKVGSMNELKLSLLDRDNDKKGVYFTELNGSELWGQLKANGYVDFSESKHKKLFQLKEQVESHLEADGSINASMKAQLDDILKESTFTERLDLLRYLGYDDVHDYKDKRYADSERFKKIIEKFIVEGKNVKIPAHSPEYAFLSNNANRNGKSFKEFIEQMGYNYITTRNTDATQERIKQKLKKRNFKNNYIYIDSYDPLYNSLATTAYGKNKSLKEFLREKYGYEQKKLNEIELDTELYDWTTEVEILDEQDMRELLEESRVNNVVIIETHSALYTQLSRYAKSIETTATGVLKKWNIPYKFVTRTKNENTQIEDMLEDLEALNSSLAKYTESKEKFKRNSMLVRKLKELYGYSCQICAKDNSIPAIVTNNGQNYVEMHHIKPVSSFNDVATANDESNTLIDHYKNCLVVCPHHHKVIHYQGGGFKMLVKQHNQTYLKTDNDEWLMIATNYHL
ncbi:hypothetical protein GCM10008929_18110 [Alkalibacterium psychrotolerans]